MNDNDHKPIRVANWREAVELRPDGCTVRCDDGWTFTFGRKAIIPARAISQTT